MEKDSVYETPISCFRRLTENDQSDNFKIILGNKKTQIEINTTLNKARIISKHINDTYLVDPTIDKYLINIPLTTSENTESINKIQDIFHRILYSLEKPVLITKDERLQFHHMMIELGETIFNSEEDNKASINSIEEAISLLSMRFHDHSIEYLSERLKEVIEEGITQNINNDVVKEIIDSYIQQQGKKEKENREEEEGEIFELMKNREHEEFVIHFLTSINPEEMNNSMIEYIYTHLDDSMIEEELSKIIFILRQHYLSLIESMRMKDKRKERKGRNIEFKGDELKGIIEYLESISSDPIGNNDTLRLSGGGTHHCFNLHTNLIQYDSDHINNGYFNYQERTANASEGWIEFDFVQRKVNLTSYTIRSNRASPCSGFHPKTFRIVGSNDHEHWDIIDHRENNSKINGSYEQHRFECQNQNDNYYRYIRYIQEDNWYSNKQYKYNIHLTCIEFFGSITSPNEA